MTIHNASQPACCGQIADTTRQQNVAVTSHCLRMPLMLPPHFGIHFHLHFFKIAFALFQPH